MDSGTSWDGSEVVGVSQGVFRGRFFYRDFCPPRSQPGDARPSGEGPWRARGPGGQGQLCVFPWS